MYGMDACIIFTTVVSYINMNLKAWKHFWCMF